MNKVEDTPLTFFKSALSAEYFFKQGSTKSVKALLKISAGNIHNIIQQFMYGHWFWDAYKKWIGISIKNIYTYKEEE